MDAVTQQGRVVSERRYRVGVDVGGTFTDFLLVDDLGRQRVFKTFTTPEDLSIGFVHGLEDMATDLGLELRTFLERLELVVHGTTITTNALIMRTFGKAMLLCTRGFRDVIEMRRGLKEESGDSSIMYEVHSSPPPPVIPRRFRIGVNERIDYSGKVQRSLEQRSVRNAERTALSQRVQSVAICLMHSYANGRHENSIAKEFRTKLPLIDLTVSSELLPKIGYYDRSSTCALNAVLDPLLRQYLERLTGILDQKGFGGSLFIMQSSGGVTSPDVAMTRSVATLASGPAAGPLAGLFYAKPYGITDVVATDMGGTSFDVSLSVGGKVSVVNESEVSGYKVAIPSVDVISIGAGGGSIAWIDDGGQMHVGPSSAGSNPGPACYGRGGTRPTVTDANLVLGLIDKDFFLGGRYVLDYEAAGQAISSLSKQGELISRARSIVRIVNANMSNAIRLATIRRGFDPRRFILVSAGGAGPLHACALAEELGIPFTLVPANSSAFCASGMLTSALRYEMVRTYQTTTGRASASRLRKEVKTMIEEGKRILGLKNDTDVSFEIRIDARFVQQYNEATIEASLAEINSDEVLHTIEGRFINTHERLYGWKIEGGAVEILNLRVVVTKAIPSLRYWRVGESDSGVEVARRGDRTISLHEQPVKVPSYYGSKLRYGHEIIGPAIIDHELTTIFVEGGFSSLVDPFGSILVFKVNDRTKAVEYLEVASSGRD